ncbi:hypothetical protein BDQ94DRAFT_154619 [Aspergillus welwitschiae]|uniref:Uncharacterized protein n=1 Tax=Aspergillus welwitschiae TaxID=1341132 RepID=A0A3F3PJV7_9EURO|nr:hypothetical protein BDQ94DRAFT_154619 [Aspergillus welwitschiae]RDH27073.1 hypothetical protein BDQ94DRAFT_154619 [Aspergillus welwitschiae]
MPCIGDLSATGTVVERCSSDANIHCPIHMDEPDSYPVEILDVQHRALTITLELTHRRSLTAVK